MDDLPLKAFIKNASVNVEFYENKIREIAAVVYLTSISEIVNRV